jgi:hypothetical protein
VQHQFLPHIPGARHQQGSRSAQHVLRQIRRDNFLDFGNDTVTLSGPLTGTSFTENIKNNICQVKVGLNYRFGGLY